MDTCSSLQEQPLQPLYCTSHCQHHNPKKRRTIHHRSFYFLCLSAILYLYTISSVVSGAKTPGGNRHNSNADRECNGIANIIRNKGFTYPWWDTSPLHSAGLIASSEQRGNSSDDSGGSSSGCPMGLTGAKGVKCCKGFDTTTQKNEMASTFTEKWMGPKLSAAAEIFKERRKKFDVTFKDLLTRAHGSFHAMFERTYVPNLFLP